jgi:hypothetical protein
MKHVTIIYVSYLILLGLVCYFTRSGYPLFGLLLIPNINIK